MDRNRNVCWFRPCYQQGYGVNSTGRTVFVFMCGASFARFTMPGVEALNRQDSRGATWILWDGQGPGTVYGVVSKRDGREGDGSTIISGKGCCSGEKGASRRLRLYGQMQCSCMHSIASKPHNLLRDIWVEMHGIANLLCHLVPCLSPDIIP